MNSEFFDELDKIDAALPPDFQKRLSELAGKISSYNFGKNENFNGTGHFAAIYKYIVEEISDCPPIKLLEDIVKQFKYERQRILTDELPSLLQAAGLNECTTDDGIKIKLKKEVHCRQVQKYELVKWLIDNGYHDFIKDKLELGKGELDESLQMFLDENGYTYKKDSGIHYQTLAKIIRDRIEAGEGLPSDDVLHVDIINIAKIKED